MLCGVDVSQSQPRKGARDTDLGTAAASTTTCASVARDGPAGSPSRGLTLLPPIRRSASAPTLTTRPLRRPMPSIARRGVRSPVTLWRRLFAITIMCRWFGEDNGSSFTKKKEDTGNHHYNLGNGNESIGQNDVS